VPSTNHANLLKRSKTTELSKKNESSTARAASSSASFVQPSTETYSQSRTEEAQKLMEDRKKERMKALTRNLEVCDLLDMRNPQSVAEYAPGIYKHLHNEEIINQYPADFMGNQTEITEKMRACLVDWIGELHYKFKMWPETLYVTIAIIDKYLQNEGALAKKQMQVLGLTALHIAGKYEEIYPPELKHLIQVTGDKSVTREEIVRMEFKIIQALDFNFTFPSTLRFMERLARVAQVSDKTQMLAQYFCDTSLLDCTLMKELPSKVAAIAVYAALKLSKGGQGSVWNATLTKNSGYKEEEVRGMATELVNYVRSIEKSSLQTFFKKYGTPRFLEVSGLLE